MKQHFLFLDNMNTTQVPLVLQRMDHVHTQELGNLSDEQLLEYALKSPSAFEFLVVRYQKLFLERALYIIKDRDEAEDVVQDTFVRIYRFAPRFCGDSGSFKSWAMTILMNVARTKYQKKAKEWKRTAPLSSEHYESLSAPSEHDAAHAKDIIERAFAFVPNDVAHILKLAFIEQLSYREIADREDSTEGAIKTRVHRAKKVLRNIIGDVA